MQHTDTNESYQGLGTRHVAGTPKILPYILCAIFGVFAVAIGILWLSIGVWDRPGPGQVDPGAGQQEGPAATAEYARSQPQPGDQK